MILSADVLLFDKHEACALYFFGYQSVGNHIISPHCQPEHFHGDTLLWILPRESTGNEKARRITGGAYKFDRKNGGKIRIEYSGHCESTEYPCRPICDFFGRSLSLEIPHSKRFEEDFARFYWDNLLLQIAERGFMSDKHDIREGYVLSTLNRKAYVGTYPAVDHEFHIKGRFAVGGVAEASLIKRMLELQLKVMREDNTGLSKNVCAVQPNKSREYDVWRRSRDLRCKAQMFRITANVEFIEGVYEYYSMTKDLGFLQTNIDAIEKNCAYIERFIGDDDLLDSHVYFEDQVIKDGKVTQAQCFAVNAFRLMAMLETLLGRGAAAARYTALAERLGDSVQKPFPEGYWDEKNQRFIDWIDGKGASHDHIHLLANELPELFGLCTEKQALLCRRAVEAERNVFNKFPSFVAAKIEEYTSSEIGIGGPYDLCAAGRYWCWDAVYKAFLGDGAALLNQLLQVSEQARIDNWLMGERYDMNYVYYNTGDDGEKNWHGASFYYEYPNVYLYVLLCQYLGITYGFDCDLVLKPLIEAGTVTSEIHGITYTVKDGLTVKNISGRALTINLPAYGKKVTLTPGESMRMNGVSTTK